MARMDEFASDWIYVHPMVTVEYAAGWKGVLPADHRRVAQAAGVLVKPPRGSRTKPPA